MHKILVIEDDPSLLMPLGKDLVEAGYQVSLAPNGLAGLAVAPEFRPELVILDLQLPDLSGLEVVTALRAVSDVPIIFLSVQAVVTQKVKLLGADVDDYLVKPCDVLELRARIARQLRRTQRRAGTSVGRLTLGPQFQAASFSGQDLKLTPTEFELVTLLARMPERFYSRREIAWGLPHRPAISGASALADHVAGIRFKLRGADGEGVLQTKRGQGYCLHAR